MQVHLVTIVCKFGGDPAICLREEAICANVYRQTDGRTDDGRRAIALAHSWNELKRLVMQQESSAKPTNQRVSYAFTSSQFNFHACHILPASKFHYSYSCILLIFYRHQ